MERFRCLLPYTRRHADRGGPVADIPNPFSSEAFRERAAACRVIAVIYDDLETHEIMLRIASGYDQMADHAKLRDSEGSAKGAARQLPP